MLTEIHGQQCIGQTHIQAFRCARNARCRFLFTSMCISSYNERKKRYGAIMKTSRRNFLRLIAFAGTIPVFDFVVRGRFLPTAVFESEADEIGDGVVFDGVGAHFDDGWFFSGTKQPPVFSSPSQIEQTQLFNTFLPVIGR